MSNLEQFRYCAAARSGKTPQEIREIEQSLIECAQACGTSIETVAESALAAFQFQAGMIQVQALPGTSQEEWNVLRESFLNMCEEKDVEE